VLVNLAVNARDAMPRGGRLTITTANLDGADPVQRGFLPQAGPYAALVVSDTGIGMTDEVREHIFEPFFTTKDAGHGTGLGLSTVYGIVQQSDGAILVDSAPGRGSTFTVCLPTTAAPIEHAPPVTDTSDARHRGTETVLLVEDNAAVRTMAREALIRFGYNVIVAPNGRDALKVASESLDRISIVLTDMVMPLMGGRELAARLREIRPDLKFVFTSGYASDPVVDGRPDESGAVFLQKPFSPALLGRTIREALDAQVA
jgi:CheY-like chemotaxis protein